MNLRLVTDIISGYVCALADALPLYHNELQRPSNICSVRLQGLRIVCA